MRSYPRNSPEAAARIVALVLISDGHISHTEYDALNQPDGVPAFGLEPENMHGIVQTLCEDLLMAGFDGHSILSHVEDGTLTPMLAEVDEPRLQTEVLRVATCAVNADQHHADGETAMLDAISRIWQTSPVTLAGRADDVRQPQR
ncbi:MAG: TerB family tellurite resistance protein [Rhodoferax sp.]